MRMSDLHRVHDGQTLTIVAPGPSVVNLASEHLTGPTIALYDAVTYCEATGHRPLYALQKDGCGRVCFDCDNTHGMVRPTYATLLLHSRESASCHPGYDPRVVFDVADFGITGHWSNSAACAVLIARHMGASALRLVSFDAVTHRDFGTVEAEGVTTYDENRIAYLWAHDCILAEAHGMPIEWVTPGAIA